VSATLDKVERCDGCGDEKVSSDVRVHLAYCEFCVEPDGNDCRVVAVVRLVGDIPVSHEVDHLCRQPSCVNPAHLDVVTRAQHVKRRPIRRKMWCVNGHKFAGNNLYINPSGQRVCRTCKRIWMRRARVRKKLSRAQP
jgi:hypothetical protein